MQVLNNEVWQFLCLEASGSTDPAMLWDISYGQALRVRKWNVMDVLSHTCKFWGTNRSSINEWTNLIHSSVVTD